MAIKMIYGMAGTGKSTLVYEQIVHDLKDGKRVLLLTPEQQAVLSEQAIAERTTDVDTLKLDILSFRRLANHVSRLYGGLRYQYLDESGKYLVLWATLLQTKDALRVYGKNITRGKKMIYDTGFLDRLNTTFAEFSHANIRPFHLEQAAKELAEPSPKISAKLLDLSLIYATYLELIHKTHDDPDDDLIHLAELLARNAKTFAGYQIYIDSFQGFTEQELHVLRALIPQAENVTITLCYDPARKQEDMLCTAEKTDRQIRDILRECDLAVNETRNLTQSYRFSSDPLAFLERNLYRLDLHTEMTCGDSVQILSCNTPMAEAEAVAREIVKSTNRGLHYREIAIVTRGVEQYAGILDSVLETYNIPYFYSIREPLSAKPLYRLILGALDILRNNWKLDDVTAYLKSGLVEIPEKDRDIFLTYLERWDIYGKRWTDLQEWNMNPNGYTDDVSKKSDEILEIVSRTRKAIYTPLATLKAAFHDKTTVRDALCALMELMDTLKVRKGVQNCDDTIMQYNGLMRSFDQIDAVVGELPVNITILSQLLNCVVSHTDLGSIPSYIDQVIIGDAALLRASNIKHAIVIGANDGVFPRSLSDADLFSDPERKQLASKKIFTVDSIDARTNDELFYAYRAFTLPSERLTVTYHTHDFLGKKKNPSNLIDRITTLFSDCKIVDDNTLPLSEKVYNADASFSDAILYKDTEEGAVLYGIYATHPDYEGKISAFEGGLTADETTIANSPLSASKDIVLSQTRFESFAKCPFQYHCKYTLKLAAPTRSDFSNMETGSFLHRILEKVLQKLHDGTKLRTDVALSELESILDAEIDLFIQTVVGNNGTFTARMKNLFRKLRQALILLLQNILEEFSQSRFTPQFFEMNMNGEANPYVIALDDGTKIKFRGQVDRVDTYVSEDGTVYVRITDYKSSKKQFKLSDIQNGINLQMFIYLFGLLSDPPAILRDRVGDQLGNANYLPAGILYYIASIVAYEGTITTSTEEAITHIKSKIEREGVLLFDEEILRAMAPDLKKGYLPSSYNTAVTKAKNGEVVTEATLKTLAEFGALQQEIDDIVKKIVTEMKKGVANAAPLVEEDPCKYCDFVAVCRKKKQIVAEAQSKPSTKNADLDPPQA